MSYVWMWVLIVSLPNGTLHYEPMKTSSECLAKKASKINASCQRVLVAQKG